MSNVGLNQLKKIIASNEMLLKNIIGAFIVKGGSLIKADLFSDL